MDIRGIEDILKNDHVHRTTDIEGCRDGSAKPPKHCIAIGGGMAIFKD